MLVISGAHDRLLIVYKFRTGNKLVMVVDGSDAGFRRAFSCAPDAGKLLVARVLGHVRSAHTVVVSDSPVTRNLSATELDLYIDLALKEIRLEQPNVLPECGFIDRSRVVGNRYGVWSIGHILALSEST